MKKILKSFVIIALSIYVLANCSINPWFTVGLDVDTTAPELAITSHIDFDYVRGTFNLQGTCSDNVAITKVLVSIKASDGSYSASDLRAILRKGQWTYTVVTIGDNSIMADGEYTFTVQAYDAEKNESISSIKSVTLYIDNAPSTVSISYPPTRSSISAWDNTSDIYQPKLSSYYLNNEFYIQGSISETFAVNSLNIRLTEFTRNNEETGKYLDVTIDSTMSMTIGHNIPENILSVNAEKKSSSLWSWKVWFKENISNEEIVTPRYYQISTTVIDGAFNSESSSHGYICVLPHSDYPYTIFSSYGDKIPVNTPLTGQCCDDDGISEIEIVLCDKNGVAIQGKSDKITNISSDDVAVKTYDWSTENSLPTIGGNYILKVYVTDINGKKSWDKYNREEFIHPAQYRQQSLNMMDLSAPQLDLWGALGRHPEITSVSDGIDIKEYSDIVDATGDFTLIINATDISAITKIYIANVLPTASDEDKDVLTEINEESGNIKWNINWNGETTISQNGIIYQNLYTVDAAIATNSVVKSVAYNIYDDFDNTFATKTFYIYAENASGKTTVIYKTIFGETNAPEVTISNPVQSSTVTANFNISAEIFDFTGIKDLTIDVKQPGDINKSGWHTSLTLSDLSNDPHCTISEKSIIITDLPSAKFASEDQFSSGSCTVTITAKDYYGNTSIDEKNQFYVEKENPYIKNITTDKPIATYKEGDEILLTIEVSKPVFVDVTKGIPTLTLTDENANTIATAKYYSGSSTSKLIFKYKVLAGVNTARLNASGLNYNEATILDEQNKPIDGIFPSTGSGSLSLNATIKIDTIAPTISSVKNITPNGNYSTNSNIKSIELQVIFNEPVIITGIPKLKLNASDTSYAIYDPTHKSNASNKATFIYNVADGDNTADLKWTKWIEGDSKIRDYANSGSDGLGNEFDIPTETQVKNNYQWSAKILIDTKQPTLLSISSLFTSATLAAGGCFDGEKYYCNAGRTITLVLEFDEKVEVLTADTHLKLKGLNTPATYSSGSGSNKLTFNYTVGANDNVALLEVESIQGHTTGSADITDVAANPIECAIPSGISIDKKHVIDTTKPITDSSNVWITLPQENTTINGKRTYTGLTNGLTTGVEVNIKTTDTGSYWYQWTENDEENNWATDLTVDNGKTVINKTFGSGQAEGFYQEYVVSLKLKDKAGNESDKISVVTFVIDTDKPKLTSACSETVIDNAKAESQTGTYTKGEKIYISLAFNKFVTVTDEISITLNNEKTVPIGKGTQTVHIDGTKNYFLTAVYTVGTNETLDTPLRVTGIITGITSGSVKDGLENVLTASDLDTEVKKVDFVNIDDTQEIKIDSEPPTVSSIVTSAVSGWYKAGKFIPITVNFSEAVKYSGSAPTLKLRNNAIANYISGSGTNSWIFSYEVGVSDTSTGDSTADLNEKNYLYVNAITGSITDLSGVSLSGNALNRTIPSENMKNNKVGIDTDAPAALTLTAKNKLGDIITNNMIIGGTNENMPITITSASGESNCTYYVTVNGEVKTNWLSSFGTIDCSADSNQTLEYTVKAKQRDVAGNESDEATIKFTIDRSEISLEKIETTTASGTYRTGTTIPLTITFSKKVKITSPLDLTLNATNSDGTVQKTVRINTGNDYTTTKTGTYTVAEGDKTTEILNVTQINGRIEDELGKYLEINNSNSTHILNELSNLAATRQINIDTIAPTLTQITTATANGWYKSQSKIAITLTFDSDVIITENNKPSLTLSNNAVASYSSSSGQQVTFLYDVGSNDSSTSGKNLYIKSYSGKITDQAGNAFSASGSTIGKTGNIKTANTSDAAQIGIDTVNNPLKIKQGSTDITGLSHETNNSLIYYANTTITVSWTDDSVSTETCKYSVNNGAETEIINGGTISCRLVNSVKTVYIIKVTKTDEAGNVTTAQTDIAVDGEDIKLDSITSTTSNGTYKVGTNIDFALNFNKSVKVTSKLTVTFNNGASVEITPTTNYSKTITGSYPVAAGDDTNGDNVLTVNSITGTVQDSRGADKQITGDKWTTVLSNASNLSDSKAIKIDTVAPTVSSISTTTESGWYKAGEIIQITVSFPETVYVTGSPTLSMSSGGTANYLSGSGTSNLIFTYTVANGNSTGTLQNLQVNSMSGSGTIADIAGNVVSSISGSFSLAKSIGIDTAISSFTITNSTTSENVTNQTKTYYVAQTISISGIADSGSGINLSKTNYSVNGATPEPMSNSLTIECDFTQGLKQTYIITATMTDNAGNVKTATATIIIDGEEIMLDSITSSVDSGTYNEGKNIPIILNFNKTVTITSDITFSLNNGKSFTIAASGDTAGKTKTATYTVASGDNKAEALNVDGFTAGVVKDSRNTTKDLTALFESAIKLSDSKSIYIDTTAPTISNITTAMSDGWYKAGSRLPIKVKFSEDVVVTGTPTLSVSSGGTATYSSGSGSELIFIYTVGNTDTTGANKNLYVTDYSGTIKDHAGNTFSKTGSVIDSSGNIKTADNTSVTAQLGIDTSINPIQIKNGSTDITGKTYNATGGGLTHDDSVVYLTTQTLTVTWDDDTGSSVASCMYTLNGESHNISKDATFDCPIVSNVNTPYIIKVTKTDTAGNKTESSCEVAIDGEAIKLESFTSSAANGTYKAGNVIPITLTFNKSVKVTTDIKMTLSNDKVLTIPADSSYNTEKTVAYTVGSSDTNVGTALDVSSFTQGAVQDSRGAETNKSMSDLYSAAVKLSESKAIKIDTNAPTISHITTKSSNGWYNVGSMINIKLTFNEDIKVGSTVPSLSLSSGGTAVYSNTVGAEMNFIYTVAGANSTSAQNLYVTKVSGDITDQAGNTFSTGWTGTSGNIKTEANTSVTAAIGIDSVLTPVSLTVDSVTVNNQTFYSDKSVKVSWPADTGAASTCKYSLNNAAYTTISNGGSITCPLVDNAITPYTISVIKTDTAGNSVTASGSITIDGEAIKLESITTSAANGTYIKGNTIPITLTFNKEVKVQTEISLKLSNNKILTIPTDSTPSATRTVNYSVGANEDCGTALKVSSITAGEVLDERGSDTLKSVSTLLAGANNLDATKSIFIDTKAPTVSSISTDTANGWYKAGSVIKVTVTFNENVKVTGTPTLTMSSSGTALYLSGSGTSSLIFTYTVAGGNSTGSSQNLSVSSLTRDASNKITDLAGNEITSINKTFSGSKTIGIDTTVPKTPTLTGITSGATVLDASGLTLGNFGESASGSGLKSYTINVNGVSSTNQKTTDTSISYNDLPSAVQNNLTVAAGGKQSFTVKLYQTDYAGNNSAESSLSFTIDSNPAKLTAVTSSKTNETLKETQSMDISLTFSRAVTQDSLSITLNNGVSLTSWSTTDNLTFKATYTVGSVTGQNTNALRISSVGGTVTDALGTQNMTALWSNTAALNLSSYNVKIDTVAPSFSTYTPGSFSESSGITLTYTFSENISKVTGQSITISRPANAAPIVMSVSEYNEYTALKPSIASYYEKTINGTNSSGTVDKTSKYVLKYQYDPTNSTLKGYFSAINYYSTTITIESSYVAVSGANLTITLPASMLLTGEEYTVTCPTGLVQDSVGHTCGAIANKKFTTGNKPQKPVIRVNKISGRGTTASQTTFKVNTVTNGATCYYNLGTSGSFGTPSTAYTESSISWRGTTYKGVKVGDANDTAWIYCIKAKATNSSTSTDSDPAYEKAFKTVIKSTPKYWGPGDNNKLDYNLASGEFMVFRGADVSSGSSTVDNFPLSWDEKSIGISSWYPSGTPENGVNDTAEESLAQYGMLLADNKKVITWGATEKIYFHGLICKKHEGKFVWKWQQNQAKTVNAGGSMTDDEVIEANYHDYDGNNY